MTFIVFAVFMTIGNNLTIWQNNAPTNQTFFMENAVLSQPKPYSDWIEAQFSTYRRYPFLNNFTINGETFVTPTHGYYRFGDLDVAIYGELRSNIFYGPIQTIQFETKGWYLNSYEGSDRLLNSTIDAFEHWIN